MIDAGSSLASIAALIGDPGRANMLAAIFDGRALTATELAGAAGVTPATASGHLSKLLEGGLVTVAKQGRHRYYRLASAEVARAMESILTLADIGQPERRATPRVPPALREARTCYDHLAGRLAVGIADALVAKGALILSDEGGEVTESGHALLEKLGIKAEQPGRTRRVFCRPCLDWSERRPHLAGVLGASLCTRCEALGWIRRQAGSRAVTVTPEGRRALGEEFGLAF